MARTLVEAYTYMSLVMSADDLGGDLPADHRSRTTVTEGPDAWTVRLGVPGRGGQEPIEVLVRYETEAEARRDLLRFGAGVSDLIDAGQWLQVSTVYARRALKDDLFFTQNPADDERRERVVAGWEFARDAAIEAAKFLPHGADQVPESAFWTEMGRAARRESPERFTRERLARDIAFYQKNLDDFQRLHGGR